MTDLNLNPNVVPQVVFEQCLETGDLDTLKEISRYRQEYLSDDQWLTLVEKYCQLYLQSATSINHPYIDLVRWDLGNYISYTYYIYL